MAKREVVWTRNSELQLQEILDFFAKRNKSGQYSQKLYKKFKAKLKTAAQRPDLGIRQNLNRLEV